jgi:hypothetical protein
MVNIRSDVEYALHCLVWTAGPIEQPSNSRDLAEMQGVSAAFVKKSHGSLKKPLIVEAIRGTHGCDWIHVGSSKDVLATNLSRLFAAAAQPFLYQRISTHPSPRRLHFLARFPYPSSNVLWLIVQPFRQVCTR